MAAFHYDGKACHERDVGGGSAAGKGRDRGSARWSLDYEFDLLWGIGIDGNVDLGPRSRPDRSGGPVGDGHCRAAILRRGGIAVPEVVGHLELLDGAPRGGQEASGNACRTPDGVRAGRNSDERPAILVGPNVVWHGAAVVVQLGIGKEGCGDPLRMPAVAVVIDCYDGPGSPFEDEELLRALIADEVISAFESEFLMAPEQVDHPRSGGMRGGREIEEVLEKIKDEELGAAIDGHGDGIRELGARIVGVDIGIDMVVLGVVIVDEGYGLEAVLLLQGGKVTDVIKAVGADKIAQSIAEGVVKGPGAVKGCAGPVIELGGGAVGDVFADAEVLEARTHGVIEEVFHHLGREAFDVVEAETIYAGLFDEPDEPCARIGAGSAIGRGCAGVAASALIAEVRAVVLRWIRGGRPVAPAMPVLRVVVEVEPVAGPAAASRTRKASAVKTGVVMLWVLESESGSGSAGPQWSRTMSG